MNTESNDTARAAKFQALLDKAKQLAAAKDIRARTFKVEKPGDQLAGRVVDMSYVPSTKKKQDQLLLTIVPFGAEPTEATRFYCNGMAETQVKAMELKVGESVLILFRGPVPTPAGEMNTFAIVRVESDDGLPF